ncbi:MAG: cupin domain-containing protein [Desulfovibrionaceae bacterium]|jgi:transcriptional regulator with XRE-family HTH domain|nr:cupin domain-containing protein [Desulfovibrionaceae bacterium]
MSMEKLGERIRAFREKQGLSREELAERSGQAADFVEAVEERDLYPSLGPLLRISRALGVRLGTFLDDKISQDPLIIRKGERKDDMGMHSGNDASAAMTFHSLGRGKSDRHMEPFLVEIEPGREETKVVSSHEGEEFIVVLKGAVELVYGAATHVLHEGDSFYYNSVVPHYVSNAGDEKAEIYAVLYFPE